ncbi:GDP-mannose 4,6-dehydratase [Candidatus Woesebacteria bacterium]|nr:GDP-mannose 4,6-dehydratase [Candidatus Woesebacteria bacterium]
METRQNNEQVVLVTGGTGFAGSHLIPFLQKSGYTTIHATGFSGKKPLVAGFESVQLHTVDLTDGPAVQALIQEVKPTQVYHLASFAFVGESFARGEALLHNNIILQYTLLEALAQYAPEARILTVGSAEVYGMSNENEIPISEDHPFRPVNPYGVSKVSQDLLAFAYAASRKLQIVRVRPFNHIGARQTVDFAVPAFANQIVQIERGQQTSMRVGNLSGIRDFTDVEDIVRGYVLLMERGIVGEVYNLGSGVGTRMSDLVDQLIALSQLPVTLEIDQTRIRPLDIPVIIANNEKVSALGWQPTIPLETSLHTVLEYWRGL